MKSYIETLEMLGQSDSIQQHDTVEDMLANNEITKIESDSNSDYVCMLFYPED